MHVGSCILALCYMPDLEVSNRLRSGILLPQLFSARHTKLKVVDIITAWGEFHRFAGVIDGAFTSAGLSR